MVSRQLAVADFFSEAEVMRDALDAQFREAYESTLKWHYFCDPGKYAFLRMSARDAFPRPLFEAFARRMRNWCEETLGLLPMGCPYLHLMINGCRLGLHSDFHNGVWGYVYSLTRWQERKFNGGETLLLRDGIPSYKKHHVHGEVLYELVPAHFNQLLVFDDRLVHATPVIEGGMNPIDGRIAMVGHIRATSPTVSDSRYAEVVRTPILVAMEALRQLLARYKDVQGTIVYRLTLGEHGTVSNIMTLTDNLVTPEKGYERSESVATVRTVLKQVITGLKFGPLPHGIQVVVPVLVPIPDLRPIEISVPHQGVQESVRDSLERGLAESEIDVAGSWKEHVFHVREPITGEIHIGETEAKCKFDPPMWVPSQREQFRQALTDCLRSLVERRAEASGLVNVAGVDEHAAECTT